MRKIFLATCTMVLLGSLALNCLGIPDIIMRFHVSRSEYLATKRVNAEVNANLSQILNKDLEAETIAELNQIIEKNPDTETAYAQRAMAYLSQKEYEKAMADVNKAIELDPKDYNNYITESIIYMNTNQAENALEACNQAISLKSSFADGYAIRAWIYYQKANSVSDYYQVLQDCDKALQLNSQQSLAYGIRAMVHLKAGDKDASQLDLAIADFNKAIEYAPSDSVNYYNRGLAYQKKGNVAEALRDYNEVISLASDEGLMTSAEQKIEEITNSK